MSRTRYNLDTPIGKVRTVFISGTRYYLIKDVCAGIGLTGHSPWSWHAKEQDNRERFYKRYDMARGCQTNKDGRRNTVTVITYEGLMSYLSSATVAKRPQAIMFRTWLNAHVKERERMENGHEAKLPLEQATPEPLPIIEEAAADTAEASPQWVVSYECPFCFFTTRMRSKFCPECGVRLE